MVKFRFGTAVLSEHGFAPYPVRMNIQQGTVKWFSRDKGWGFVRMEDGNEIFVHHTDIEGDGRKTLEDDERVEFSIERMDKGPRARNVKRLDSQTNRTGQSRRSGRSSGRNSGRSGGGSQRTTRTEHASDPAKSSEQPASLAEQLRSRLTRLFPGIGS